MVITKEKLDRSEITEENYQRNLLLFLDNLMKKFPFNSDTRDWLVNQELIAYGDVMAKSIANVAQRRANKFESSVHNLSSQQLAIRFLGGQPAEVSRPTLQPIDDEFLKQTRKFMGLINKNDNVEKKSPYFQMKREATQKGKQKNEKLDREIDTLFQTAKDRMVQLEIQKGLKPSYPLKNSERSTTVKQTKAAVENKNDGLSPEVAEIMMDERAKSLDPAMVEKVLFEIVENIASITWDDIAGLEFVKESVREIVIFPMLRPDLFTGLRSPVKGLLLFGPPGTGKTMIGKCIASESKSTFFSISSSSLTSKYIGDSEKMVRTLFTIARIKQPAVIFIDEIDSLLTQRCDTEHEASRRLKTEFLVQFDGVTTAKNERLLVIGATNRPQELDEAARRRFVKKLYIPLPSDDAREEIVSRLMRNEKNNLSEEDKHNIASLTVGYSGADVSYLCQEAALGPIRKIGSKQLLDIDIKDLPPISMNDFEDALTRIKASVSDRDMEIYEKFNNNFGAVSSTKKDEKMNTENWY
ncbi:Fidgetin-like protein 1 [Leptotrombidium deliense]|uniref:Fidgetin-like protein 1 n=1 Tax=Leptotrombidium deliense TaxID=299467 RepID=A0A443SCK1_9ACAR|nr:Fidgetin-like protein 1 [Leptotrombidium deliense]